MLLIIFHAIVHFMGLDYGLTYGHMAWYNFWSGIAGSFFVGMVVWTTTYYIHHTCHASLRCFRWGKYEAAGGMFKLCWKHHPDMTTKRPSIALIHKLHRESKS